MAHEFLHAYHDKKGDAPPFSLLDWIVFGYGWIEAERQVRGVGKYKDEQISENIIRFEQGLPQLPDLADFIIVW